MDDINKADLARMIGREPCCDQDFGGSHYHCPRCWAVTSMLGHHVGVHWFPNPRTKKMDATKVESHLHCPDYCELISGPWRPVHEPQLWEGDNA